MHDSRDTSLVLVGALLVLLNDPDWFPEFAREPALSTFSVYITIDHFSKGNPYGRC